MIKKTPFGGIDQVKPHANEHEKRGIKVIHAPDSSFKSSMMSISFKSSKKVFGDNDLSMFPRPAASCDAKSYLQSLGEFLATAVPFLVDAAEKEGIGESIKLVLTGLIASYGTYFLNTNTKFSLTPFVGETLVVK